MQQIITRMKTVFIFFSIIASMAISQRIYAADAQEPALIDTSDGENIFNTKKGVTALAVTKQHIVIGDKSGNIRVWDFSSKKERVLDTLGLRIRDAQIRALAVNGNQIIVGSDVRVGYDACAPLMCAIRSWDIDSDKINDEATYRYLHIKSLAVSGHSLFVAADSIYSSIDRRDVEDLEKSLFVYDVEHDWIKSLAASQDGTLLAAGNISGEVYLYTGDTLQTTLHCSSEKKESVVKALAFSSSGKQILAGLDYKDREGKDGEIALLDTVSSERIVALSDQPRSVKAALFTPDDKLIISAGSDGLVKIRDVRTYDILKSLEAMVQK